ncbi:hypothetical protein [Bosea sp. RAF48]|uniref:hypothetical protein n=1 Tax=Bosea sp. RAF48 TaxID=3237480 RepID=UPI003F8E6E6D
MPVIDLTNAIFKNLRLSDYHKEMFVLLVAGEIEPETARGLFESRAEKHDLLAPDVAAFIGCRREGSRGRA